MNPQEDKFPTDFSNNNQPPNHSTFQNYNSEPQKSQLNHGQTVPPVQNYKSPPFIQLDFSPSRQFSMSLEFFNYIFALVLFSIVYPSTFWQASRAFSFTFSLHLIIHTISAIFSFLAFRILYRIHNLNVPFLVEKNGASNYREYTTFWLDKYLLLAVYLVTVTLSFMSSTVVYGYGYNKFCLSLWLQNSRSRMRGQKTYKICCEGYCPHICAIIMLVLMVAARSPLLYDQMTAYQHGLKPILLVCVVSDVTFLFCWILLWLFLTLVRDWDFQTRFSVGQLCLLQNLRPLVNSASFTRCNGLFLMCGDELYATDDENKKLALMRMAERCGMGRREDDVYWLKPHGNQEAQESRYFSKKCLFACYRFYCKLRNFKGELNLFSLDCLISFFLSFFFNVYSSSCLVD